MKKLYKSNEDQVISGVAGGLADYLEIDSTVIRLIFLSLLLMTDKAIIFYMLAAIFIPRAPFSSPNNAAKIKEMEERIRELEGIVSEYKDQDLKSSEKPAPSDEIKTPDGSEGEDIIKAVGKLK